VVTVPDVAEADDDEVEEDVELVVLVPVVLVVLLVGAASTATIWPYDGRPRPNTACTVARRHWSRSASPIVPPVAAALAAGL
jgi:hypothetical protein